MSADVLDGKLDRIVARGEAAMQRAIVMVFLCVVVLTASLAIAGYQHSRHGEVRSVDVLRELRTLSAWLKRDDAILPGSRTQIAALKAEIVALRQEIAELKAVIAAAEDGTGS